MATISKLSERWPLCFGSPGASDRFKFVEQIEKAFGEIASGKSTGPLLAAADEIFPRWLVIVEKFQGTRDLDFVSRVYQQCGIGELFACTRNICSNDRTTEAERLE